MPSLTAGLSGLPAEPQAIVQPEKGEAALVEVSAKAPPDRTSPPRIRPPRLG
jgi:hypothetical protein